MIQSNPMIRREFQLEVWTWMIQKSMVIPPSTMVLYNYHYIGGLIAPIARRHFVYCNIYQSSSILFFLFQKLTWLVKKYTLWSNGQRYSFMAIQLKKALKREIIMNQEKGSFLFREISIFDDIVPIYI